MVIYRENVLGSHVKTAISSEEGDASIMISWMLLGTDTGFSNKGGGGGGLAYGWVQLQSFKGSPISYEQQNKTK